jgi:hypothetical protein
VFQILVPDTSSTHNTRDRADPAIVHATPRLTRTYHAFDTMAQHDASDNSALGALTNELSLVDSYTWSRAKGALDRILGAHAGMCVMRCSRTRADLL